MRWLKKETIEIIDVAKQPQIHEFDRSVSLSKMCENFSPLMLEIGGNPPILVDVYQDTVKLIP
jgi:hypothetical protein